VIRRQGKLKLRKGKGTLIFTRDCKCIMFDNFKVKTRKIAVLERNITLPQASPTRPEVQKKISRRWKWPLCHASNVEEANIALMRRFKLHFPQKTETQGLLRGSNRQKVSSKGNAWAWKARYFLPVWLKICHWSMIRTVVSSCSFYSRSVVRQQSRYPLVGIIILFEGRFTLWLSEGRSQEE
jgi:hypothetical protein